MKPQNLHAHEDRLLDFAYGELSTTEAQAVESHLQGCVRCTQALDDIRGVRVTMSQLSEEPAPDAGLESLLAYAQQSARRAAAGPEPKPSRWRRWFLPVVGLASVGTLGIVSFMAVSPDLTRPDLRQVEAQVKKAEPTSVDAPPPPTAGMAPAPASAAAAAAYADSAPVVDGELAEDRLMHETRQRDEFGERKNQVARRAEDWDQNGSGGGIGSVGPREASRSKSKGAPSLPTASLPVTSKPAPKALEKRAPVSDELEAPQGKVARREPLRLGGSSAAKKESSADLDDKSSADVAAWEEAEGAPAMESAAESLPQAVVAQPPPAPPQDDSAIERSLASRTAPAAPKPTKQQEDALVMRPKSPKAASTAPEAAKEDKARGPSVRELSLKAEAAFREGDRAREAGLLNLALNAGASGTERMGLLNRLCDAELALGRRREGLAACRQVIQESPGSSAAQAARRRLSREADSAETPAEPAQPAP
ncbi:zf-HC2 domain-containing protein [Myxococcus sp. MISCRS1]|uniref:zf-HC2 domain-containing protein n=1 Tax=Myxococcus sp. MISCRS1 TaxID=2996786 RepID=UPI00227177C2|nr:zf-HC2 domain-containing protein [Myxococcus sp. MISCRS1]MCY1002635.1 zf-HC2 domain-containing protein [Myxococcus sp. MISCRS1]